jgi:uncharacterized membrane protein
MAKKHATAHAPSSKEVEEGKVFAFLGVFLTIIGFIIVLLAKKDNKYAMYYAKQGLVLFIAAVIVGIVGSIIPFLGWFVILPIGNIIILILWIIGWINALSGKEKPIPWIGQFADKFNI